MANINTKIEFYLGREFDGGKEIIVRNDMDGNPEYIDEWHATDKPQPTMEELDVFESQADELEALRIIIKKRKFEYPSIQELVVALYDSEDKTAVDEKRAAVKLKYPKP